MLNSNYLELRTKYPYMYLITYPDNATVVFRPLTWGEYQSVVTLRQLSNYEQIKLDIEDEIFKTCVIDCSYENWRDDMDYLPAGLITTTVNVIMQLSGADNPKDLIAQLDNVRPYTQTIYSQVYLLLESFFKLTKDDINKMYFRDIMHHMAMSEQILAGQYPEPPFKIVDAPTSIDFEAQNREEFKKAPAQNGQMDNKTR